MTDLGVKVDPETGPVTSIPFRFEVSWQSLTCLPQASTNIQSTKIWQAGEPALRSVLKREIPGRPTGRVAPSLLRGPSFAIPTDIISIPRQWLVALAGGLLVVCLAFVLARTGGAKSSLTDARTVTEMGAAGWVSEWASDPKGSALGRQISLYRPSAGLANYSLEFTGRIERKSLGWVFRAADTRNYYVAKLQESRSGGRLMLTRFAVVKGVEGPHIRVTLPVLASVEVFKIRLEARRSRFTIYVQNKIADHWQEDQLATGGVGFVNERDERGRVESVRISVLKDGIWQ